MKKRGFIILIICILILVLGFFAVDQFLKNRIVNLPIKSLTEEKLSSLLGAKVSIEDINFGLVKQLSLSGLRIDAEKTEEQGFYLASAKAITLRYNFNNLINQDFQNPHKVTLDSPNLLLRDLAFPENFFEKPEMKPLEKPSEFMGRTFQLAIKNGRADYPFMENKYKIGLKEISGVFIPQSKEVTKVELRAKGSGILRGDVLVYGEMMPIQKSYDIRFRFRGNGEIFLPGFMKLKKVRGKVRIQPNKIIFEQLRFSAADLLFEAKGEIVDFESGMPKADLSIELISKEFPHSLEFQADLAEEIITGSFRSFDLMFPFSGEIFQEENSLRIADMKIFEDYFFNADFNIQDNAYQASLEKDLLRVTMNFSFDDWDTILYANLEHVPVYDIDVVAFVKLRFMPTEEFKAGKSWKFNGTLSTDYLILDTLPLEDLDGTFFIDHFSLKDLDLQWGSQFKLVGNYDFLNPEENRLALELNSVDLHHFKRILFYERPEQFEGIATGYVELTGNFKNPLITGHIDIANGMVRQLNYKTAFLRFSGYYPYLRLANSKITKKSGSELLLEGDLNLRARNIFQDLKVLSEDHIVLWRGVILSESLQENLVMIGDSLKRKLTE